jgi:hypothetical protein
MKDNFSFKYVFYLFQNRAIGRSVDNYVEKKVSFTAYPRDHSARHFVCCVINEAVDQ